MRRRTALRLTAAGAAAPALAGALAPAAAAAPARPRPRITPRPRIRGVDISSLPKSEAFGGVYRDFDGSAADPVRILGRAGSNWARLKVWVDPADGYHTKPHILAMAQRLRRAGMKLMIDFHYSDTWADPGKQYKPAAWEGLAFPELRQAVYDHTADILGALHAQRTPAGMVQIGNELNGGMLWPDGRWDNWPQLAQLLTAGADAARAASPGIRVALHLADGGDNGLYRWWFDNAVRYGVPFDVIAASFYGYWHGTLDDLRANLGDVSARYGKDVVVVETAYPFTLGSKDFLEDIIDRPSELVPGYPATPEGQAAWMRDICEVVTSVPGDRGLGVFYWEPAWTAVTGNGWDPADPSSGNGWENQAWFDYDNRPLPAMRW
ncbi:arabinogalactan endo-1,4-beta-galactosidase [Streptomyces sp. YIM 98790]|uniref:glycoside hydrolase family 53 protein n=1 Tax=Streptomyces sp. YIM 98790 TaxID=2689077 RepID=UPI0014091C14|nr:arabinogalactan endo-1,4-beta-galactosidase [Streptomyces sp. YIM 98790]